ncbi:hypothetical protein [Desulfocurvus sp.]|uniref:hypothetical protein n=1 Tax=Desulfocurvus sp. TaxID=2871698 RepID=UPI0025C6FF67|nr:hypothetical protein [Desulfocurvus sp.]MCK9241618.1 hypothetical protein [Desulfocurvus sp.]
MTTPTFSLRHPPRRHRAEAVAACFLDACSTVRAVHGAAALPAALAGAVAIGRPLNAATSPCPDLARLMDLASSSCMASRQLRFADGCHHVQAFRCGASHLHVSGLFLVFEPCRSSAPPPAELLREFCAAAAITGEEVAVYDLAGALVGHHPPAPGGPGARPGRPGPPPAPPRLADVLERLPPAARDSLARAGVCAAALRLRDRQAPVWLRLHRVNSWDRARRAPYAGYTRWPTPGPGRLRTGRRPRRPPASPSRRWSCATARRRTTRSWP